MAKRHSHYRSRGTSRRPGRGRFRGKAKNGSNNGRTSELNKNSGHVGGGDLSNPEMVEDYYFGHDIKKDSMRMGGFRPGKAYNLPDKDESNLPLRKRPIVFIKAVEIYDPSHDLIEKLREQAMRITSELTVETLSIADDTKDVHEETSDESEVESIESVAVPRVTQEVGNLTQNENSTNVLISEQVRDRTANVKENVIRPLGMSNIPDDKLFFVDEEPETKPSHIRTVKVEETINYGASTPKAEFEQVLTVGKTELNLVEDDNGDVYVNLPNHKTHPFYQDDEDVELDDFDVEISDENGDEYDEELDMQWTSDDEGEASGQMSPTISSNIGNLTLEDMAVQSEEFSSSSEVDLEKTPEFGFMEEDFAVNISEISITNIRLGARANSYYLSSYRFFGDYEFRWVDQDDLSEYVVDLGLPEHRIGAYLGFVNDSIIPKTEEDKLEKAIAKEVAVLDDSDEDEDEDEDEEEDEDFSDIEDLRQEQISADMREGLDDLISYATKYDKVRNQFFETKSLTTSGRGTKKKLLFDEQLDLDKDLKSVLQDKFTTRKEKKAMKKQDKQDFISEANKNSDDLFLKYPFGCHVQNIKDEFELFLVRNKPTMSFPPLDPHGNKTITKFAQAYYMKTKKAGKSGKTHVVVEKVKKTKWSTPSYGYINQLINQRPIFMRIDVRKPMEERIASEKVAVKGKFHIKEGGLVGENAPVIGTENIGRIMLEKLGWSSGQGLGAHGNKGISEPILAKVKISKSGLRHSQD